MKQELFKNIVDLYIKRYKFDSLTTTEDTDIYVFKSAHDVFQEDEQYNSRKIEAVKRMKKGSCKISDRYLYNCLKTYVSIKYDKKQDKISSSSFQYGYVYSARKNRYVPYKVKRNLFCYSNKLYSFISGKNFKGVRIATPSNFTDSDVFSMITGYTIQPNSFTENLSNIPYNYYIGSKDGYEALEKYKGTPIPKALRVFRLADLEVLVKVLKDTSELNKVCQHIAKMKKTRPDEWTSLEYDILGNGLWVLLADMMFGDRGLTWLVRDWVADNKSLNKKLSLKLTSVNRVMDEHHKLSQQIRLKGIKSISVKPIYKKVMVDFPIKDAELIKDKERLLQEGISMEHCVASYGNMINQGQCAILSMPYEGERWTAEISVATDIDMEGNKKVSFQLRQLRGKRNKSAPTELSKIIERHLVKNSTDNRNELHKLLDSVDLPF